jgi:hypothetical protein
LKTKSLHSAHAPPRDSPACASAAPAATPIAVGRTIWGGNPIGFGDRTRPV